MTSVLEREEYIEQAYFFRILRKRIHENLAMQDVLARVHEEILSTTRLPMAIQFLATEIKHTGLLSSGFVRLSHYFTPFQAYTMQQTEDEKKRFSIDVGLLILEREAQYRAGTPTPAGLFVYQFEALSRNRLGYDEGLLCMQADPYYDDDWKAFVSMVHRQVGVIDFADMVYLRSHFHVHDQRRHEPAYESPIIPLFGEKEGKIAKANRGRDPLYLFGALQRQLGYPEVPRPKSRDDLTTKVELLNTKIKELETRLKLVEGEVRGHVDLSEFLSKPELIKPPEDV